MARELTPLERLVEDLYSEIDVLREDRAVGVATVRAQQARIAELEAELEVRGGAEVPDA